MLKIVLIAVCLLMSSNVFALKTLIVQESCVKLNDIYPQLSAREITCKLNYGDKRKISKERLNNLLYSEGIKGKVLEGIQVERYGEQVTRAALKDQIFKTLTQMYPSHRLDIQKIKMHNDIYTDSTGFLEIKLSSNGFGSIYANVFNGIKTYRVYLYVKAYQSVNVSNSRIRKGEVLTGKYEQKEMDVTSLRYAAVENPEKYIARRSISANKIISTNFVEGKPINFAGDHVSLIYNSGTIRIATMGVLEDNAYIGKKVRVKNMKSGKYVHAKAKSTDQFFVTF